MYVIWFPRCFFINYSSRSWKFSPVTWSSDELSSSTSVCVTWTLEQGKLFGFILLFSSSSWGGAGLGEATCAVQLGDWTRLHRVASGPREVSCVLCCHLSRSSAVTSLTCQLFLPSGGFASALTVCAGRDVTALRTDDWHVSCRRRRSRGRVTVTSLFPASECKEVAEDGPQAEGVALAAPGLDVCRSVAIHQHFAYGRLITTRLVFFSQAGSSRTQWTDRS